MKISLPHHNSIHWHSPLFPCSPPWRDCLFLSPPQGLTSHGWARTQWGQKGRQTDYSTLLAPVLAHSLVSAGFLLAWIATLGGEQQITEQSQPGHLVLGGRAGLSEEKRQKQLNTRLGYLALCFFLWKIGPHTVSTVASLRIRWKSLLLPLPPPKSPRIQCAQAFLHLSSPLGQFLL